jgi:NDP-sugar pyrophosphorylase family protein
LALNDEGRVLRYDKTGIGSDLRYVEAGALCFKRSVFAGLPPERTISLEQEVYPELIARRSLSAFVTNQRFFDIGTPDRLEEFSART